MWLQNSHVEDTMGNTANNIATATDGASWGLEISGGTLSKVYECLTTKLYT